MSRAPILGISIFFCLFFYSTTLYPGGSQADMNSVGFDYVHNYWCNLTDEIAQNGQPNPASPFSIFGMQVLCMSLLIFFVQFARTFSKNNFWKRLIIISGVLSMIFASMIFTSWHNYMIITASAFGLITAIGLLREVYLSDLKSYKLTGLLCVVLLIINNYMYYGNQFTEALPLLQKLTIAFVVLWIAGLNYELIKIKRQNTSNKQI